MAPRPAGEWLADTIAAMRRAMSGGAPLTALERFDAMAVTAALSFANERVPNFADRFNLLVAAVNNGAAGPPHEIL